MRNFKTISLIIVGLVLSGFYVKAQQGTVRGTVIEDASGEPMFGVTVAVDGTTKGAVSDFEGTFNLKLDPGTYNLMVSFISYKAINITGVTIASGEITTLGTIRMKEDVETLEDVIVVTAEVIKNNEAALLTVKRKSANLLDGISAANFAKIGDSDAGAAIKRVTGVSVEGGKYVYVRGLGDRYTKTMLNTVDIPGLDPDRNSLQIDIFPTNLIQNMIVLKSAVAEMPADFTGGVVNIETKDFPEERILDVSFGVSYNPNMHFNNEFLEYDGGDTDWLGFDDGTRDLPAGAATGVPLPDEDSEQAVFDFNNSLNPNFAANTTTSLLDYNLGLTYGDQISVGIDNNLGFILSGTYRSTYQHFDDRLFGEYQIASPSDEFDLVTAVTRDGVESARNILLGGLAGLAFKTKQSKYKFTTMRLQNGQSKAGQFFIVDDPEERAAGKSGFSATNDVLTYDQRSLTNYFLGGEHSLKNNLFLVDWRLALTNSELEQPDIREAAFTLDQGRATLSAGQAGLPFRSWRFLDEDNYVAKVDFTYSPQVFQRDSKIKAGASFVYKERDYALLNYNMLFSGSQPTWTGNPNEIMQDQNIFPRFDDGDGAGGLYFQAEILPPNSNAYNSSVQNASGYVSAEFSPLNKLKAVVGLRMENYVQKHTGRSQEAASIIRSRARADEITVEEAAFIVRDGDLPESDQVLIEDEVLNELGLFPSLNLIYNLKETHNLRLGYSRTIARPTFKELSFAQIIDPISDRIYNGGLLPVEGEWDGNLTTTDINNFDLRYEIFPRRGELISASLFYKTFDRPIELVRLYSAQTNNEFQTRNVGNGRVYGFELEFRKKLDFLIPSLNNWGINGNLTLTESQIDMFSNELEARREFLKEGEDFEDTREMAGQAPYVINAGITYENIDNGLDAGIFYNVQGPTLLVVGGSLFPDVFTEPFHSLNFNLNKRFGESLGVNLSVSNVLNDVREQFFQNFEAEDQYFERWSPGTSIGVGISYSF
ncbi:MAG: TonB-dependent receptor [Bacteroidota bacterium]